MNNRKKRAVQKSDDAPPMKRPRNIEKHQLSIPKRGTVVGNLLACGQNDMGQLGLGEDVQEKTRPVLVSSLKNVVDICAGGMHSLCLTASGEVWSFGCNDEGALGRDTSEEGSDFIPKKVDLPGLCVKISAGDSHSAGLLENGQLYAWGSFRDSHGNMGLTLEGNKRTPVALLPNVTVVDIASGADHLLILSAQGKIYTVGCGEQGQLGRVTQRSASGESRRGKTELLKPEIVQMFKTRFIDAIWATNFCTFYRDFVTKKIYGFGLNNYNQLALSQKFKKQNLIFTPKITQMEDVKAISGGQHHTLIISKDNQCYAIGRKDYGRLGLGEVQADVSDLKHVVELKNSEMKSIGCGDCQSFAVTNDGKVFAWGMGNSNQLGLGSEDDAILPTQVKGVQVTDKKVFRVDSGGQHTLFLIESSTTKSTSGSSKTAVPASQINGSGGDGEVSAGDTKKGEKNKK
ncbi:Regulator of chromosome condensation [Sergentomyia squamirostris]